MVNPLERGVDRFRASRLDRPRARKLIEVGERDHGARPATDRLLLLGVELV